MASNELIDTTKAAAILGVSPRRVRQLVTSGRLNPQIVGGNFIFNRADLAKVRNRKPGRPKKKS
jgi:hypothetical protein